MGGSGQSGAAASGGSAGASSTAGNAGTSASGGAPTAPSLTWKLEDSSNIYAGIWGSSASDVYAVGRTGRLAHSVGDGKWTSQPTATAANITGIWGASATDIYASVNANFILHSAGDGTWQHQDYTIGTTFDGVWGSGTADIYVVGPGVVHGTGGGKWTMPPQDPGSGTEFALWGSSATDLYVVRDGSGDQTISHSPGDGSWKTQTTPSGPKMQWIWGADSTHVYAAGGNVLLFSNGDGTWVPDLVLDPAEHFGGLWGLGADSVYACTSSGHLYRSNGRGRWSAPAVYNPNPTSNCYAVWGTADDNIYLATGAGIFHGTP